MNRAAPFGDAAAIGLGGRRADLVFEVLAHPYRRFALWYLWETGGRTTLDQLAREIQVWQSNRPADGRGVGGRATVGLSLRHTHLPKLADADLVAVEGDEVALRDGAWEALVHLAEVVER